MFGHRTAVVTGASSGIGKAIALALASKGATVCLVARSPERLEEVAALARTNGGVAWTYPTDLTSDEAVGRLTDRLRQDVDGIDMLVHGAGVIYLGAVDAASVEHFDIQYRTNVRAPYLLTQRLLPMLRSRLGQIIFINSSAGLKARAKISQYAATKHALRAVADSLRDEVNEEGLRVVSIFPGRTATPQQAGIFNVEGRAYDPDLLLQPEDIAALVVSVLALDRTAEVTDVTVRPRVKSY